MGDGDKKGSGGSPAPLLIAALVVAVSIVAKQFDLESRRPAQSERPAHYSQPLQTVSARLWQDPFAAIGDLRGKSTQAPPGIVIVPSPGEMVRRFVTAKKQEMDRHVSKGGKPHINVILVPVFGGPYAEYSEGRRRQRYAIATGLLESDFEPVDAEKLGVLRHTLDDDKEIIVPFEWYSCKERETKRCVAGSHLVLMWVNDDLLPPRPIARLRSFYTDIESVEANRGVNLVRSVIGPAGSGTLISMLAEAKPGDAVNMRVLSPNATIEPRALLRAADVEQKPQFPSLRSAENPAPLRGPWASVQSRFNDADLTFISTIGTDGQTAAMLAREATLRQYSVQCLGDDDRVPAGCLTRHKILIVAEGDTEYARSLAATFIDNLVRTQCGFKDDINLGLQKYRDCRKSVEKRVFRLTYLRGLDGETARPPGDTQDKDSKRSDGKPDPRSHTYSNIELLRAGETAAGNVQFDYLRRLGRSAKAIERGARAEDDAASQNYAAFHSIAIFGSDAYDKLLVMQVLRSEFPSAYFMTTDMDARYLQREQLDWSRNLVVASSYGLELSRTLRDASAPFRDSYQSAQFIAARLAVNTTCDASTQEFISSRLEQPRLFEISTAGPVELRLPGPVPIATQVAIKSEPWLRHAVQRGPAAGLSGADVGGASALGKTPCQLFMKDKEPISSLHAEVVVPLAWHKNPIYDALVAMVLLAAWYSLTVRRVVRQLGCRLHARWPEILLGFAVALFFCLPKADRFVFWLSVIASVFISCVVPPLVRRMLRRRRLATGRLSIAWAWIARSVLRIAGALLATVSILLFIHAWTVEAGASEAALLSLPLVATAGALAHPWACRRFLCMRYPGAILATAFSLLLGAILMNAVTGDGEEPAGFLNGASSWLSEGLRIAALVFNVWAIGYIFATLRANEEEIRKKFFLDRKSPRRPMPGLRSPLRHPGKWLQAAGKLVTEGTNRVTKGLGQRKAHQVVLPYLRKGLEQAWAWLARTWGWLVQEWKGTDFLKQRGPNAGELWMTYLELCKQSRLLWRAAIGAALFLYIFVELVKASPIVQPVRGVWSGIFDTALLLISVFTFFWLIFLVVDVVRLTAKFVHFQSIGETNWPSKVLPRVEISGVRRVLRDTTDLELLSRRTEAVSHLVILPFIPLLLLVLARHELLDAWAWTWPMLLLFGLCFLFLIVMSVQLRGAAEKGKTEVLTRLGKRRLKALGKNDGAAAEYLDSLIKTMERVTTGAYSPVWQAEWLRGLAIPTTGYGAFEILRAFGAF